MFRLPYSTSSEILGSPTCLLETQNPEPVIPPWILGLRNSGTWGPGFCILNKHSRCCCCTLVVENDYHHAARHCPSWRNLLP